MAKNKFGIQFDGFLRLSQQIDELGHTYLKKATDEALTQSKQYVDKEVETAMKNSPYNFYQGRSSQIGVGGKAIPTGKKNRKATGRAKKSANEVGKMQVEWNGQTATAYAGVSWYEAPEVTLLAYGTPHVNPDKNLLNAVKCKGKVRKEASRIQQEAFIKVLEEAQRNG